MIDINELRRLALDGDLAAMQEIIHRLEAAEKERDALRADKATLQQMMYSLKDRLEVAENENAKLRIALAEKVTSETMLRDLSVGNGSINATFEGGAIQLMVDALATQFVESGASNYIEMQFHSEATGPLVATLQRVNGKTPHQLRAEAEQERDALRAKIAAMEQQEPVAWLHESRRDSDVVTSAVKQVWQRARPMSLASYTIPLYLAPGAQPAPSVPEDVMRDAERYRYLRARDDETAGIGCWIEAEGRACDRGWLYGVQLDSAIDTCIEMLAAAPEAKP